MRQRIKQLFPLLAMTALLFMAWAPADAMAEKINVEIPVTGQINAKETEVPPSPSEAYSVKVTKYLKYEDRYRSATYSFYAALFWDEACTQRAGEVLELRLEKSYCTTAEFKNLAPGTYYLAETDEAGTPLDLTAEDALFVNEISQPKIELTPQAATAASVITNYIEYPDGFLLGDDDGEIVIDKTVVAGTKESAVTDTFYFTLFSDEGLSNALMVQELSLTDAAKGTLSFTELAYGTYYLAETDESGVPVDNSFAYDVTLSQSSVSLGETKKSQTVSITNDLGENDPKDPVDPDDPKDPDGKETKKTVNKTGTTVVRSGSTKTGDTTDILLYLLLLFGAVVIIAGAAICLKKKNKSSF